jgi:hypothetical protein
LIISKFFKSHCRESNIFLAKGKRVRESRGMYQISFQMSSISKNAVTEELTADVTKPIESKLSRVGSLNEYFIMIVIQHCDFP